MPIKIKGRQVLKQKGKFNLNTSNKKDCKSESDWDATAQINVDLKIPSVLSNSKSEKDCIEKISVQMPIPDPNTRFNPCDSSISTGKADMQSLVSIKNRSGIFPVRSNSKRSLKSVKIPRRFQKSSHIVIKKSCSGNIEGKVEVVDNEQIYELQKANSSDFLNEKEGANPLKPISLDGTEKNEEEPMTNKEPALEQSEMLDQFRQDSLNEVNEEDKTNGIPGLDMAVKNAASQEEEEIREELKRTSPDGIDEKDKASEGSTLCSVNIDIVYSQNDRITNIPKQISSTDSGSEYIQQTPAYPQENVDIINRALCSNLNSLLKAHEPIEKIQAMKRQLSELEEAVKSQCFAGVNALEPDNKIDEIRNQPAVDFCPTQSSDKGTEQDNCEDEDVDKLSLRRVEFPRLFNEVSNDENVDNFINTQIIEGDEGMDILLKMRLLTSGDKSTLIRERVACLLEQLQDLFSDNFDEKPAGLPFNDSVRSLPSSTQEDSPVSMADFLDTSITTRQNESIQNILMKFCREIQEFDDDTQKEVILMLEEIILLLETLKCCQLEKQSSSSDKNIKSTPRLRCLIAQLKLVIQPLHPNPSVSERTDVSAELGCLLDALSEILRNESIDYENLVNTGHILCYIDDELQQQGSYSHPLNVSIRGLIEITKAKVLHSTISNSESDDERIPDTSNSILPSVIDSDKSPIEYANEHQTSTTSANFANTPVALVISKFHELIQNLDRELSGAPESTVEKLLTAFHQIGAILESNCENIRQLNEIKDTLSRMEQKIMQSNSECLHTVNRLFFSSVVNDLRANANRSRGSISGQRKVGFRRAVNFIKHRH